MYQLEAPPKVGDVLMLEAKSSSYYFVCRVIRIGEHSNAEAAKAPPEWRWEAEHLFVLGKRETSPSRGAIWWGPDEKSWVSVTNMGPCIPAEPAV